MRSLDYCNYLLKLLEPHQISHSPPSLRITPGSTLDIEDLLHDVETIRK